MKTKVPPVLEDSGDNVLIPFEVTCATTLCGAVLEVDDVADVTYVRTMRRLEDSYGHELGACGFTVTCPHCGNATWLEQHTGELPSTEATAYKPYPGLEQWHRLAAQRALFNK